jgi:hypothetical protein
MKLIIDTDVELNAEELYGLYAAAKEKEGRLWRLEFDNKLPEAARQVIRDLIFSNKNYKGVFRFYEVDPEKSGVYKEGFYNGKREAYKEIVINLNGVLKGL